MASADEITLGAAVRLFEGLERVGGLKKEPLVPPDISFIDWCEGLAKKGLKVDGKPFRLDDRPVLRPIYEAIPTHPEDAFQLTLIIQKATQIGLTVWEVLAVIYLAAKWEPLSIGSFMPDQSTATFKSEHRFMRIVRSAPEVYELLLTKPTDESLRRPSEGNILTRTLRESILMFLWTSGRVTTESRPMDIVALDEVQEMALGQIDKVRERMGDSHIQLTLMLSTANLPDLDINFWYKLGNQQVWHSECPSCGKMSDLMDPVYFPGRSIAYNTGQLEGAPVNEYVWACPHCGGWIRDPMKGQYITQNPAASPKMKSWLIPRLASPRFTPREAFEKYQRAKTGDQKKSLYNRMLARPYIDADQLPVTMAHCLAAVEEGKRAGVTWKKGARGTYMGIDQMGGFNAVIIKERLPDGRQATIHVEAVFNNDPFERCSELMDLYGVEVCVVEQLPNVNDARRFANAHKGRVFLASYADLRDDQMQWGDDLSKSDRRTSEEDRSRYSVSLNQYKCMQTALFRIRDGACLFPDPDQLEQDVIDDGVRKRIPILRDWVFVHFTKTALVVEHPDEVSAGGKPKKNIAARRVRMKVAKVGLDPHYAFANMLCDVAWARSHGTGTIFIPTKGPNPVPPNDTMQAVSRQPLPIKLEELPKGMICGNCTAFSPELGNLCKERGLVVAPQDPGCPLFTRKKSASGS